MNDLNIELAVPEDILLPDRPVPAVLEKGGNDCRNFAEIDRHSADFADVVFCSDPVDLLDTVKNDAELMQVQLPGTKAAKILMTELEQRIPEAEFGKPAQPADTV